MPCGVFSQTQEETDMLGTLKNRNLIPHFTSTYITVYSFQLQGFTVADIIQ